MLVYVCFIILTFAGGALSGHKPPGHDPPAFRDDSENPGRHVYKAYAEAQAYAEAAQEETFSDFYGKSITHSSSKSSSFSKSSSYKSVVSHHCGEKCKDPNTLYKDCPNPCPLSCDYPFQKLVQKCAIEVVAEPIRCPKNSHYVMNDNQCPKTCGNRLLPNSDATGACVPFTGCACKPGYVRKYDNATGPCIKKCECPPIPTQCGENEIPTSCAIVCPPQTCESMFTDYYCLPTECEPGCDCLNGFLRKDGVCIPSENCFEPDPIECGPNEVYSDCAITCPPQTCESLFVEYDCAEPICAPGCNCFEGFLRNSLGDCVPIGECYNDPEGCNGDLNATRVRGCSGPSRPTCENPEPGTASDDICELNGCECKPGYIVSCDGGDCIDIKDCPGGSPKCGANQTYVGCKFGCPTNYCPENDIRAQVACSMPYPCQGGCACKAGFLIVSRKDPRCIKASDCPKVKCTRPNEVWDSDSTGCFSERCEDRDSECDYPNVGPRCVCKEGFHRNVNDTCIPDSECPPLSCDGDYNATLTECPNNCPKTCDDPYAGDGGCIEICGPTDCQCNPGYFLTKLDGGICIKPEDCGSCAGDPNAKFSNCPSACEPTCTKPDRNQVCTRQCMPPGCVCRDGFVLNQETGKCTKPESCPSGCGGDPNAVYTTCTSACEPTCDNPDPQICTLQCLPPSCVCKPGFVKSKDGKCIKPETCPGCAGDPNAKFSNCPSACEPTCTKPDRNQVCNRQCMPPGCVCRDGFVLNQETGKCTKPESCPSDCGGDSNALYTTCTSACEPTCDNPDPQICTLQCLPPSCVCKPGFVKSKDGKCIKPETCPAPGCKDPNAVHKECPSACEPTCSNPDPKFCTKQCTPPRCVCKPDYVLNEKTGKCVKRENCPGCAGDPNAKFSNCPSACEPTCTKPDRNQVCNRQCMPPGCVCRDGFVLNQETGKCTKPESCPSGCGGDPNAVYTTCTSACEPTCDNPDPQICTLQCLPPSCVCKPGFVKSKDGKCIKPETCPVVDKGCNGDLNATHSDCPSSCPPTCENRNSKEKEFCPAVCDPSGCVCKQEFILTKKGGKCVLPQDCPVSGCKDPNAVHKECPSACEPTCSNPDPKFCTKQCTPPRCVCKPDYVLNEKTGKCVKRENCPADYGCKGDINATYSDCTSACPTTCADRFGGGEIMYCPAVCGPPGCVCKPEYILTVEGGQCILPEDCPETDQGCKGDPNAEINGCPSACEPTCSNPDPNQECTKQCLPAGCVCKQGFVLNEKTVKCVERENCPVDCGCKGDMNATYSDCSSGCPTTCADLNNTGESFACAAVCGPPGCVCKPDFVLIENGGICVLPEDCPKTDQGCKGDPKAEYNDCPSACEPTCSNPDPNQVCTEQCLPAGCVCKQGLVLNEKTGKCVERENCPVDCGCKGDMNATYSDCTSGCPTTCADLNNTGESFACAAVCGPPGCVCKPDFVLIENGGICVLPEDCPKTDQGCKGDPEAEYNDCPSACEPTCSNPDPNQVCTEQCLPAGCICKQGLVLNEKTGKCVERENCPVDCGCKGDMNATYSDCTSGCPTTCADLNNTGESFACAAVCGPPGCVCKPDFVLIENGGICVLPEDCPKTDQGCKGDFKAEYNDCPSACEPTCSNPDPNQVCTEQCLPAGCVCKQGFVLNEKTGKCVERENCPVDCGCKGDMNATYSDCTSGCPTTCADLNNTGESFSCAAVCGPPGCICKPDFVLIENGGICVLPEDCPDQGCKGDANAEYKDCPSACPATCENPNTNQACTKQCMPPGCVCKRGFVKSKDGKCIKPESCPVPGCGGDPNAMYSTCPSACERTCDNTDPQICTLQCLPPGCVCKPGFVKSKDGKCMKPETCPGGWPNCGANETYVNCYVGCPNNYCPVDDSLAIVACDPPYPCPGGCACKGGYLMVSEDHEKCILASDCPKVKCTRPNEVWDPYALGCLHERCDDKDIPCDFQYPGPPRCRCIKGYYRNKDDICVPECQCLKTSEPICEPGCNCLPDHLRNGSGICIPYDQCPYPSTPVCGINEIASDCRRICPPQTCQRKYIMYNCIQDISCEPGCDCVSNYLRDERGICIPSEKCPPAPKPELVCGYNEVAVSCRQICPPQNCEIAYTEYACTEETKICEPGCNCLPDHLRNGSGICIPNDQCPYPSTPVCGINEIARDCRRICPPQTCLSKYALFRCVENLPCEPGCDCVPNYLRDERGICIPSEQCPAPCQISEECKRTCARPNPKGCVYNPPKKNMKGCDCKEGFILSDSMGDCIPIDQCPPDIPCHGDPNARPKRCPKPCPSTCESPNQIPCKRMCEDIACECKSGYLLSNNTDSARCILPDKCLGGHPCGKCGHFVDCKTDCKGDYCPVDDSRDPENCDYSKRDCLSGCICKINHKRKSREDPRCILSSKCHRVNCTRPNEKWSSCPSACLAENCEDINNQPINCNPLILNCEPRCICKKNHFRNSRGICVPAKKCRPQGCGGDKNAVYSDCPSACEPTCDNPDPQICTDQCLPAGCVCKNGFVFNKKNGKCVKRKNCPVPDCKDPNAVYKKCTSACEPTCANPEPHGCTEQCMPAGCVCKKGFVLNEKDGKCIKACHCPDL